MPKVLIVDDHPLFRDALAMAASQCKGHDIQPHFASTVSDAIDNLVARKPALLLLDLNLSDSQNFEGLTRIRATSTSVPIIVVSANETMSVAKTARTLGAQGYVPKSASLDEISNAISSVLNGEDAFPDDAEATNPAAEKLATLTPAQQRVMSGLSSGLLNKQIAYEMGISEATVKAHMTSIFRKLGASNRTQALLVYRQATQMVLETE